MKVFKKYRFNRKKKVVEAWQVNLEIHLILRNLLLHFYNPDQDISRVIST